MTSQPQNPPPRTRITPSFLSQQWFQLRLFWSLFKDPEVGCLLKAAYLTITPLAVLIYWIIPEPIPYVDDLLFAWWLIPFALTYPWTALLPNWLVDRHRALLLERDQNPPPPPETEENNEQQTETPASPPPQVEVDPSKSVAIHRTGTWSVFHFTQSLGVLVRRNRRLRGALNKLGELEVTENYVYLKVPAENEAEAVTLLSKRIDNLRVVFADNKK